MRKTNSVIRNIIYAFGAQGFSMLLSVLMALFLPKVLGVTDYSYWQLFIFYISYAGFFHFGFNDGVYLKQGGKDYDKLDHSQLNSDLMISTIAQITLGIIVAYVSTGILHLEEERIFTIIATIFYVVLCNYSGFLSYILQVSNRIKEYSLSVVIDKIGFMAVVVIGIATKYSQFKIYIICYILSKMVSTIFVMYRCKKLIKAKPVPVTLAIKDAIENIQIGLNLTVSNVASMLILGVGRSMIDSHWGVEAFGKFSLALSLSNFFLQFISQVSLVLFPAFRRLSEEKISDYYEKLRLALSLVLSGMMLGYMPLYYLLSLWLPQYAVSLRYMVILLPICIFDGKMNMLCNTYLKVLRKEKMLLRINFISLATSFLLCSVSTYILNNIYAVIVSMVFSIAFRSVIAETFLSRYFGKSIELNIISEIALTVIFVVSTWFLGAVVGFCAYACVYTIFFLSKKQQVVSMIKEIKKK